MISIPKTARKSSYLGLYSIDAMLAPTVAAPASPPIVSEIKVGFSDIDAKTEGSGPPPPFREAYQWRPCLVPVDHFCNRAGEDRS